MCYYNGCKVTRADYIRLMALEKELKNLQLNFPAKSGFDYRDWPIIMPNAEKNDFEIKMVHWEYIPASIHDEFELQAARKSFTWLNAKGENLLVNEKGRSSMYKEGALNGRCIVLSTGFYEWRHLPKIGKRGQQLKATERIPYRIGVKSEQEYFFIAGVSRRWTNERVDQSADTFAVVTTVANSLMMQVHNTKKRMPVILTEELANEWIFGKLDEKRILEIASYQYPSEKMYAYPVSKSFLSDTDPTAETSYENLPALES
jgi:putative SOS response-associated peptidase YedK